jgi:hypothetical protein
LRVPIAIRAFYESGLWILQTLLLKHPDLHPGLLGKANPFDLTGHTLRFTPDSSGYRIGSGPLNWDSDYGPELGSAEVNLKGFAFPFPASFGSRSLWEQPDRSDSARLKRTWALTHMVIVTGESS